MGATSSADAGDLGRSQAVEDVAVIEEADGVIPLLLIASSQHEAEAIASELRYQGTADCYRALGFVGN
jgi:hypothetical protein